MTWMIAMEDVLAPVLEAPPGDIEALAAGVNQVAETLAFMGVLYQDKNKKPIHGMSDEQAVTNALKAFHRDMVKAGRVMEEIEANVAINRIAVMTPPRRVKGAI